VVLRQQAQAMLAVAYIREVLPGLGVTAVSFGSCRHLEKPPRRRLVELNCIGKWRKAMGS